MRHLQNIFGRLVTALSRVEFDPSLAPGFGRLLLSGLTYAALLAYWNCFSRCSNSSLLIICRWHVDAQPPSPTSWLSQEGLPNGSHHVVHRALQTLLCLHVQHQHQHCHLCKYVFSWTLSDVVLNDFRPNLFLIVSLSQPNSLFVCVSSSPHSSSCFTIG